MLEAVAPFNRKRQYAAGTVRQAGPAPLATADHGFDLAAQTGLQWHRHQVRPSAPRIPRIWKESSSNWESDIVMAENDLEPLVFRITAANRLRVANNILPCPGTSLRSRTAEMERWAQPWNPMLRQFIDDRGKRGWTWTGSSKQRSTNPAC